jgi:HPt (histidine-containing phosphotransfer) domain-containing protein
MDVQKGIAMTGGTLAAYKQVLSLFCKDAEDRLPLLQRAPTPDVLTAFITHVHALKSASASLGAEDVSAKAAALEAAGKAEDMAFIRKNLSVFAQKLGELAKNIRTALQLNETAAPDLESSAAYSPLFKQLADALETQKSVEIDLTLEELNQKPLDAQTREALQKISDDVLMAEFDSALKIINSLRAQGNKSGI